jgi:hypothetical protein
LKFSLYASTSPCEAQNFEVPLIAKRAASFCAEDPVQSFSQCFRAQELGIGRCRIRRRFIRQQTAL